MPYRRTRDTEQMDRILLWAVQSQGQWRSISTELSPDRHKGRLLHPSQLSRGCSTITEERDVRWSWQHSSRTGLSRRRRSNYCFHDNLQQNLADRRMANPLDPVLGHHPSQEEQLAAVPELPNDQPHQPTKQSHAEKLYWTDWRCKRRRSLLKNRQASQQEGIPQSRFSAWESFVRNSSSTNKTSTISS